MGAGPHRGRGATRLAAHVRLGAPTGSAPSAASGVLRSVTGLFRPAAPATVSTSTLGIRGLGAEDLRQGPTRHRCRHACRSVARVRAAGQAIRTRFALGGGGSRAAAGVRAGRRHTAVGSAAMTRRSLSLACAGLLLATSPAIAQFNPLGALGSLLNSTQSGNATGNPLGNCAECRRRRTPGRARRHRPGGTLGQEAPVDEAKEIELAASWPRCCSEASRCTRTPRCNAT